MYRGVIFFWDTVSYDCAYSLSEVGVEVYANDLCAVLSANVVVKFMEYLLWK